MNQLLSSGLIAFIVLATGCQDAKPIVSAPDNAESTTISPGVGTDVFRVGMTLDELLHVRPTAILEKESDRTSVSLRSEGVALVCKHNPTRVATIAFYFQSREFESFQGQMEPSIATKDSIRDVFCRYGEPQSIWNSVSSEWGEYPGSRTVVFNYFKKGFSASFIDGVLSKIMVFEPNDDPEPYLLKDIGDTKEFRSMKCD